MFRMYRVVVCHVASECWYTMIESSQHMDGASWDDSLNKISLAATVVHLVALKQLKEDAETNNHSTWS